MVARHDLTTDPELKEELLTVRRGTAFFARKLGELTDEEFDAPSLLPGWTRRHLIAHVGYNARAITRLVQWANTGVETPMYDSPEARNAEIDFGATLPVRALRHLIDHAAISLDVEWRDSPDAAWEARVKTAQGRDVPARETVWMRTREVWLHAIDLDNGARFSDIPEDVLARLLRDITAMWRTRGTDAGILVDVDVPGAESRLGAESGHGVATGTGLAAGTGLVAGTGVEVERGHDGVRGPGEGHGLGDDNGAATGLTGVDLAAGTGLGSGLGHGVDLATGAANRLDDQTAVAPVRVSGSLPDLVRWASGRGDAGVRTSTGEPVAAPRWL